MTNDERRLSVERRSGEDRRLGVDTRSDDERRLSGERRANNERRWGSDRRSNNKADLSSRTGSQRLEAPDIARMAAAVQAPLRADSIIWRSTLGQHDVITVQTTAMDQTGGDILALISAGRHDLKRIAAR